LFIYHTSVPEARTEYKNKGCGLARKGHGNGVMDYAVHQTQRNSLPLQTILHRPHTSWGNLNTEKPTSKYSNANAKLTMKLVKNVV